MFLFETENEGYALLSDCRSNYVNFIGIAKPLYPGSSIEYITCKDYIFFDNAHSPVVSFPIWNSALNSGNKPNFSLYFLIWFVTAGSI